MTKVNLSKYQNKLSKLNQIKRLIWSISWFLLVKPLPRSLCNRWKIFLLRLFGAKINSKAVIYSTVKIYAPWNLEMKEFSCLAPEVDCYNVDKIIIGAHSTVSQKSYLCSASHDVTKSSNPLITAPIIIKDQVWIGADVFLGMGVTIEQGAVVGARSSVYKNIAPWTIVGGNPAKLIKKREVIE
ncbi:putative colanic acid biosynthesis acetyltransferase [uncultured Polaribacter sp.]|uniref:putative colanic acid biosynthesis acetyltransferase n=1 Tax=uncultured Polaribacter sp. TaxID=174711 RepID=UPI0026055AC2|nr:putative colanic acid biosynthesis acetyltransferase [uncultured Polaribacter sp.]